MDQSSRREFLQRTPIGLAAVSASSYLLIGDAMATEPSGKVGEYGAYLKEQGAAAPVAPRDWRPTEDNILGPFYRKGAPYRAKVTPPMLPGEVLHVSGRVYALDTRKPLAGAVLDIWQANAKGRYDNDDPARPPAKGVFENRARLLTDESGYYEFETIRPGPYKIGQNMWRPSHIHYLIRAARYQDLITQLYFKGDPYNGPDRFIKTSLIIDLKKINTDSGRYDRGVFDIVLAPDLR